MTSDAESTPPPLVLVVDDEPAIRKFLRVSLAAQSYRIVECDTARGALAHIATDRPDVLLLDLGLPDGDGVDVVREIREWSSVPIIVISARGQERDKVAALDAGADDYLTKPFGVNELLARLRVALRHASRRSGGNESETPFVFGSLIVDLPKRLVTRDGVEVKLTPNEYKLLSVLVKHAGLVVTHQQLLRDVWGPGSQTETHYLRVYVNQLRQKLSASGADKSLITTIPGVGYRLSMVDQAPGTPSEGEM